LDASSSVSALNNGANYSWNETTYTTSKIIFWNDENRFLNYSINSLIFNYTTTSVSYYGDEYYVNTTYYYKEMNYSVYYNLTFSGNKTIDVDLNIYRVDISYGDGLQLVWMAMKDGTLKIDTWITDYNLYYNNTQKEHVVKYINHKRYDGISPEPDLEWNETVMDYWNEYTHTSEESPPIYNDPEIICNDCFEANFSAPLIITTQVYTTTNGDKVFWADMFYDYIMFNDTNGDGVYSPEFSNSTYINPLDLNNPSSDEWCGNFMPLLWESSQTINTYNLTNPSNNYNNTFTLQRIKDKTIEDLSSTIEFTAPSPSNDNVLNWEILYPDYPIYGMLNNGSDPSLYPETGLYNHSEHGDYIYKFDYEIGEGVSTLDYTINLPKFANATYYNKVQGMSLAMPHYTYIVSTSDVEQIANTDFSLPSDLFEFHIDGTPIAEIDMINPEKKNYSLYDYPYLGNIAEFEFIGATVNELITETTPVIYDSLPEILFPGMEMIFTLDDIINDNAIFQNGDHIFCIETQNYAYWSGERLVHDPTLRAYFVSNISSNGFPWLFILIIIGCILGIAISIAVPINYMIRKQHEIIKDVSFLKKKGKDSINQKTSYLESLLENEQNYDEINALNPTIIKEDFWEKIKELELNSEDEQLFIKDILSLPPQERENMLNEMLNLKKSKKNDIFIL